MLRRIGMDRKKLLEFEYDGKNYAIVTPTQDELLELDMASRKAFSHAIREGLMVEFEAKRVFEKNGTWTDEHEKEIASLQMAIVTLEMRLAETNAGADGRELCFKLMEHRNRMMDMINHKARLFSAQTAEGYAEAVKTVALTWMCTVDSDNNRVFKSREDFSDCSDDAFAATCYAKAMIVAAGLQEQNLEFKMPEQEWLKANGYVNETGAFTEAYYREVLGVEEEKVEKPKRARKGGRKKRKKAKKIEA